MAFLPRLYCTFIYIYLVAVPEDTFATEVARLITFQATKAVAKDHCTPVVILLKLLAQPKINRKLLPNVLEEPIKCFILFKNAFLLQESGWVWNFLLFALS